MVNSNDMKVTTSFTSGTTINMNSVETKKFLENIAVSTIVFSKKIMVFKDIDRMDYRIPDIPEVDDTIDRFLSGIHGSVLMNLLESGADLLYKFVEDCILNKTVEGLYLLCDRNKLKIPMYKIITTALESYQKLCESTYEKNGKDIPDKLSGYYTRYNEKFEQMMEGTNE